MTGCGIQGGQQHGSKLGPRSTGPRASTTCTITWPRLTIFDDREAVEILLAALVPCPRTLALWLIGEH